jgi:hypothetical protein
LPRAFASCGRYSRLPAPCWGSTIHFTRRRVVRTICPLNAPCGGRRAFAARRRPNQTGRRMESAGCEYSDSPMGGGEPLRIGYHLGDTIANQVRKRIAQAGRTAVVPESGFSNVAFEERMVAKLPIHFELRCGAKFHRVSYRLWGRASRPGVEPPRGRPTLGAVWASSLRPDRLKAFRRS